MTDEELTALVDSDHDRGDLLNRHFEATRENLLDWVDVSHEGRRVYNLVLGDEVEEDSLVDDVLSAIAAAGNAGGLGTIARMLGLDAKALEDAVWDWQFSPENKREYGYEALVSWCAERAKAKHG